LSNSLNVIPIKIEIPSLGEVTGELIRVGAPRTVEKIVSKLPIKGKASLWKEEIYFSIGINLGREKPSKTVEKGAIAYWPMGDAICFFFGNTQPYSEVNICGKMVEPFEILNKVKSGQGVIIKKVS
jgi:hypothetical protein